MAGLTSLRLSDGGSRALLVRLNLHRHHGGEMADNWRPAVAGIGRRVHLTASGSEVDPALVERIDRHRVAKHVDVAIALRQSLCERLPFVSALTAAEHLQFAVHGVVLGVALDRNDVDGFGLVSVDIDHEAEVRWEVTADLFPRVARVVAAHDVPVL